MIFIGDIHGDFEFIIDFLKRTDIKDTKIIQVGDFGIGYNLGHETYNLLQINNLLNQGNNTLYVIRGNHDDPTYFSVAYKSPYNRIIFVHDYTRFKIDGYDVLFVGGARSVDRELPVEYRDGIPGIFFDDENVFIPASIQAVDFSNIDILVTHSGLNEYAGKSLLTEKCFWAEFDPNLIADLTKEREVLRQIHDLVKPKYWIFGHFHNPYLTINFEDENTLTNYYRCLDINEVWELQPKQ